MAAPVARQRPLTVEEYLLLEETASVRHEYVAGEVHALAGASRRHNRIQLNIATRLIGAARGGSCRIYVSEVKLRAASTIFYYPDVVVACGPPGAHSHIEETACLVVEVLSPSTATTDRREKALVYKGIASLRAYLIVHQDTHRVERHYRDEGGEWYYADSTAASGAVRVPVPCPEVVLTLGEIYEGAELEAGDARDERADDERMDEERA
ncbi:MAG: Uma2 family endonuclease [Gemmatimonadaceae bacterium]